jgi:hypothetical protein
MLIDKKKIIELVKFRVYILRQQQVWTGEISNAFHAISCCLPEDK